MKNIKLTLNRKLALIAFVLGFIGLFAGSPYKGHIVSLNAVELSAIVENTTDHVSVSELADWIIQGKTDFRVIDLRTENEFNEYHIPNAENILITDLEKSDLKRTDKIIIYSEGGIHSAQAWMLLKAMDFKGVYILFGGLEEWKSSILFPSLPETATDADKEAFEKTKEISKYFGGTPTIGGFSDVKKNMPKLDMPKVQSPGGNTKAPPTGKKKKEGC